MAKLFGNPLYYWTHMELKQIFGITEPLNEDSASRIYEKANEILQGLSVQKQGEKAAQKNAEIFHEEAARVLKM